MKTTAFFLAVLLLCHTFHSADSGAACFAACAIACCEVGAIAFAVPLGIAVGVTGCTGVCMVACAVGSFVPPACFANNTQILVASDAGGYVEVPINLVQPKDRVLTLVDNIPMLTTVIHNIREVGSFKFVEFEASAATTNKTLMVTHNHGMLITNGQATSEDLILAKPGDVHLGDTFASTNGLLKVTAIRHSVGDEQYTLVTAEGTVIASGILVSTLCEEEVAAGKKLIDVIPGWKDKHQYER